MGAGSVLGRVALALGATVASLAGAEAVLRRVAPVRTPFYQYDARLLYRPRPLAAQTFHYPHLPRDQDVRLAFDARGFRGQGLRPDGSAARVIVYGDSFVEARLTPEEKTFARRLQARLQEALGTPVEAVNAGVSGYGPDQSLLRMEGELPALRPRAVVVVLYAGNDWGDLVRNALFRVEEGRLVEQRWRMDEEARTALDPPRGLRRLALFRALRRARASLQGRDGAAGSRTVEAALAECRREHQQALREPGRVGALFVDHYDADLALEPSSASAVYKRALMRAVLERLRGSAAARRVPVLGVIVPAPEDVAPGLPFRPDARGHADYRPSGLTDALEADARAAGLPCLNLFDAARAQGDGFYYPLDWHWNAEAQDAAARSAADVMLREGWLR